VPFDSLFDIKIAKTSDFTKSFNLKTHKCPEFKWASVFFKKKLKKIKC
jgi:hypothetical protein